MSDYISKSALIDIIVQNVVITTEEGLDLRSEIVDLIKNQPTVDEKEIIRKPMTRVFNRLVAAAIGGIMCQPFVTLKKALSIVQEEGGIDGIHHN